MWVYKDACIVGYKQKLWFCVKRGEKMPFYEDFSDLIFKIESYLDDSEAYNTIVESCYQIAKNNHNSKDCVKYMLHVVD